MGGRRGCGKAGNPEGCPSRRRRRPFHRPARAQAAPRRGRGFAIPSRPQVHPAMARAEPEERERPEGARLLERTPPQHPGDAAKPDGPRTEAEAAAESSPHLGADVDRATRADRPLAVSGRRAAVVQVVVREPHRAARWDDALGGVARRDPRLASEGVMTLRDRVPARGRGAAAPGSPARESRRRRRRRRARRRDTLGEWPPPRSREATGACAWE